MGLFSSSKSSTTSTLRQEDNRQTGTDNATNLSVNDRATSLITSGNSSPFSVSNSTIQGSTLLVENLNADLAGKAIDEVIGSTKESIINTLGFADDVVSKVFDSQRENLSVANNQLEETRDFAAGLISQTSETADQRLSSFSTQTFVILAALFGLVIWRS